MRAAVCVMAALLVFALGAAPAYAADDDGGFLDALASLGNTIKEGFTNLLTGILDGLKFLFIPSEDYFIRQQERLEALLVQKFANLATLISYLGDRFSGLKSNQHASAQLVVTFPQGHFFGGTKLDLMGAASGLAGLMRGAFTGFISITTAVFVWKKAAHLIDT